MLDFFTMKRFGIPAMLVLTGLFLFTSCASQDQTQSTTAQQRAVPGERTDGRDIAPAPGMGAGAKIGW